MLTIRENFLETIRGGKPDRFVNQWEYMVMIGGDPISAMSPRCRKGAPPVVDCWGVTKYWPENVPGAFPIHDEEHRVIKDIEHWKDSVKMPNMDFPDEDWKAFEEAAAAVDRSQYLLTVRTPTGMFEQAHYLMSMGEALAAYYTNPDEMHELIDFLTEYELKRAKELIKHAHPDCIYHSDDWGSHNSSFLSPEMFNEFFLEDYKKLYQFYRDNGVEIIIHHSDSYAANLVPSMIEMGVDVWQGCVNTNNVPALVKEYGGRISFMGDLNNGVLDVANWTPELVEREVRRACTENGKLYYIPCLTMGGASSTYPGVYECVSEAIDRMSKEMF